MLCETCRWSGRRGFVRAPRAAETDRDGGGMIPCPDCGGTGIAHCCDGICAQPDAAVTGELGRNGTAHRETIR
jgi:hypothetical protein